MQLTVLAVLMGYCQFVNMVVSYINALLHLMLAAPADAQLGGRSSVIRSVGCLGIYTVGWISVSNVGVLCSLGDNLCRSSLGTTAVRPDCIR